MARVYIADDFEAIRARMAEIRRERTPEPPASKKSGLGDEGRPLTVANGPKRKLLRDLAMNRRFRNGRMALSPA